MNLSFGRETEHVIFYDGIEVGSRRADFIVEAAVLVELKAIINLEDVHTAQAKNYVVAYDFQKGLLINFGARSLQYKLIFNPKYTNQIAGISPKARLNNIQHSKYAEQKKTNEKI